MKLFNLLFSNTTGKIELRAFNKDTETLDNRLFINNFSDVEKWIEKNKSTANLCFGVCTRKLDSMSGQKNDCFEFVGFWVDIDIKKNKLNREDVFKKIKSFTYYPSVIVDSGNGLHVYWLLKEPLILTDDNSYLEGINKGLATYFNGDHVGNIDRVLRIPGTNNYPTKKKRQLGIADITECKLIESTEYRYNLNDFDDFYQPSNQDAPHDPIQEFPFKNVEVQLNIDLARDSKLKTTWEGNRPDLKDKSRSGYDMALASMLARKGYSKEEVKTVLANFPKGKFTDGKNKYFDLTVNKAFQNTTPPDSHESPDLWPEPIPFDEIQHPQRLSLDLLPTKLASVIEKISERMKIPPELAFSVSLGVISTAIGKQAKVKLINHTEVSAIWTCCILPPGSRKSAPFKILTAPLIKEENKRREKFIEEKRIWESKKILAEAVMRDAKNKALKSGSKEYYSQTQDIMTAKEVIDQEPFEPHLWTADATPQSLVKLIAQNGSIGVLTSEGGSIFDGMGQYSNCKGSDLCIWLSGYSGDAVKTNRKTSESYAADEAILSIATTVQPDVIQNAFKDEMYHGRGFLDRWAFFLPADPRGSQKSSLDDEMIDELYEWNELIENILKLNVSKSIISLNHGAQKLWINFQHEIQDRIGPKGDLQHIAGWLSKLAGLVGRISSAYHFCEPSPLQKDIDSKTMAQAIKVAHFLIEHFNAVIKLSGQNGEVPRAKMVLNQILSKQLKEISPSQISKNGWGGCKNADEAKNILKLLSKNNYVKISNKNDVHHIVNPRLYSVDSGKSGHVHYGRVQ